MELNSPRPAHRVLQQQPVRQQDRQQQQSSGSGEFQPHRNQQMGDLPFDRNNRRSEVHEHPQSRAATPVRRSSGKQDGGGPSTRPMG